MNDDDGLEPISFRIGLIVGLIVGAVGIIAILLLSSDRPKWEDKSKKIVRCGNQLYSLVEVEKQYAKPKEDGKREE